MFTAPVEVPLLILVGLLTLTFRFIPPEPDCRTVEDVVLVEPIVTVEVLPPEVLPTSTVFARLLLPIAMVPFVPV